MGNKAGVGLRFLATFFYALEFCCAAIILGIYSYFLAKLSYHDNPIKNKWRAVEGISGAAVLYTVFAVLLTCFLGGNRFFAFLAIFLDIAFAGAFIAVAVLTDDGADSCNGVVTTPLGTGDSNAQLNGTHLGFACKLNTAAFAVAIAGALLFLISVALQLFVTKHHQKEKKYGPSPANNYTSGSGNRKSKGLMGRLGGRRNKTTHDAYGTKDAEMSGGSGLATDTAGQSRYSGTTAATETYPNNANGATTAKYESASGYTTAPVGSGQNPYGYNNASQHPTGTAVNY